VTGATGFIGRYVVAELARRGVSPVIVCRPSTAVPAELSAHPIVHCDIDDARDDSFARAGSPDLLIHLAWNGLPNYRSLHHFDRELPSQYAFLRRWIESGLAACLVTGTCFEYGNQSGALAEDLPARPTNPYGFAKDALRQQLAYLRGQRPFRLTWARLFYLWGDGQASSSLWSQLKQAVAQRQAEFPMSGGEQLRDYLPVTRVAAYVVDLALSDVDPGIVNICSGVPTSVRSLVERWIAENGWPIVPALGRFPYPDYEPMAFWGDARKLHALVPAANKDQ